MRFIKAYMDGYGKFNNRNFVFEPGFNLFLGPNEAGKTTMMSFLRTIFLDFREGGMPLAAMNLWQGESMAEGWNWKHQTKRPSPYLSNPPNTYW